MKAETIPEHYKEHPDAIMTNCNHTIEHDLEKELKEKELYSQYAGWNFCGYVWWNNDKWSCEVWVFHNHVKTYSNDTLEGIMTDVSYDYGSD